MIVVSGGTGFVGRALVERLTARGLPVGVVGRHPPRQPLPATAHWIRGDLAEPATAREVVAGADTVVHLAAMVADGGSDPSALERANVQATRSLALAAAAAGVRHFVHVSSAGVYGDSPSLQPRTEDDPPTPRSAYERTKLAGERALLDVARDTALPWTILRPTGVFGPGRTVTDRLFRDVARRRVWLHGPSRVLVHPLYVHDLAAAIDRCLGDARVEGQIVNVAGDRVVEYRELLTLVGDHVGRRPLHLSMPRWSSDVARLLQRRRAPGDDRGGRLARLSMRVVNRSVAIDRARRLLGFEPTPLAIGLEATARALGFAR